MLLSASFTAFQRTQNLFQSHLTQSVTEILQAYGSRTKSKENYIFAQLGPSIGMRLQLKFNKGNAYVKGTLIFENGRPVIIPQIYRNSFLKTLQQKLHVPLRFYFSLQNDNLLFNQAIKLDQNSSEPISMVTSRLKPLISCLRQVQDVLIQYGVTKKLNKTSLKQKIQRFTLVSKTVEIVKDQKNLEQYSKLFINSEKPQNERKGSVFKYYTDISEVQKTRAPSLFNRGDSIKKGGYFEVQKKTCQITKQLENGNGQQKLVKELAIKKLRKDQQINTSSQRKLQKQIKILNQIKNPEHTLTYWLKKPENQTLNTVEEENTIPKIEDKMYMDYAEQTLDDVIYGNSSSITEIIDYSTQIVEAVKILQESGIVHRDLKPDNVLIQTKNGNPSIKDIKIIDFAESMLTRESFKNKEVDQCLGSTMPYSPLECYLSCQQGYNSSSIDLWSVGLIIYQMLYKKNPLSYSRCFAADIYRGWKMPDQFSIFASVYKKNGIRIVQLILSILTINSVRVQQKQRLSLVKMKQILQLLTKYLNRE